MSDQSQEKNQGNREIVVTVVTWVLAIMLSLGLLTTLFWQPRIAKSMVLYKDPAGLVEAPDYAAVKVEASLPQFVLEMQSEGLKRDQNLYTEGDQNLRTEPINHVVVSGDSIWALSNTYGVTIESILYANYDILQDKSDNLVIGQTLVIPPVDGIYHTWRTRDSLSSVASRYGVTEQDILLFIGNNLDLSNPEIAPGTQVMVPGGARELVPISYAAIVRDAEGRLVSGWDGPGSCALGAGGLYGNGFFIWPSAVHYLTGNDYGPGHNGIDIGAGMGSALFAADSGTVVYAGWLNGGYGNFVVIDHGNGYSTLYEHLESLSVSCGEAVFQGSVIGTAGTTGNSTGPHLHFEIRYANSPVNPWDYLP